MKMFTQKLRFSDFLAPFLTALCFGGNAHATNWFVDPSAPGPRDGTSWAKAWANVTQVGNVQAGDTVFMSGGPAGGTKTYRTFDWVPRGGTTDQPVTYRVGQEPDHCGTIIFDGLGTDAWWLKQAYNVRISGDYNGSTNILVKNYNLSVYGDGSSGVVLDHLQLRNAVRYLSSQNIHIGFCYIQPPPESADFAILWQLTGTSYTNNSVHDSVLRAGCQNDGSGMGGDIIQGGSYCSIYNNLFSPVFVPKYIGGQHQDGIQNNNGGVFVRLFGNVFENISNYGIYWELINNSDFSDLQIYNNVFRHNASFVASSGYNVGVVIGPQGISGRTYRNILVANNTFADMYGRSAIAMGQLGRANTWVNCQIVNNLTINCGNSSLAAIVFDNPDATKPSSLSTNGVTIAYNLAIKGDRGSAGILPAQLALPISWINTQFLKYAPLDPLNDLRLTGTVPLGINLSPLFATDAAGNPRSSVPGLTWALGAYEPFSGPKSPKGLRILP